MFPCVVYIPQADFYRISGSSLEWSTEGVGSLLSPVYFLCNQIDNDSTNRKHTVVDLEKKHAPISFETAWAVAC